MRGLKPVKLILSLSLVLVILGLEPMRAGEIAVVTVKLDNPPEVSEERFNPFIKAFIEGARLETGRKPIYKSAYYVGGYPPETEGVCTDVIWRAMKHAGYDLKKKLDADIRANPSAYPRVAGKPDPHIDFRRVPNQRSYFGRHWQCLTKELIPGDEKNMDEWRPGDIVTFQSPDHIAILSDRRNKDGLPYLLHNDGPWASEGDDFMSWYGRGVTGHFRYPEK